MPNSLSKWFSSPRSGTGATTSSSNSTTIRRRRESEHDESINGGSMTRQQLNYEAPPVKRARVHDGAATNGLKRKPPAFNYTTTSTTSTGYNFGRSNDGGSSSDSSDTEIYDTPSNPRQLNIAPLDAKRRYDIDSPQQQRFPRQFPPNTSSTPRNLPEDVGLLQNESEASESGESSASMVAVAKRIGSHQQQPQSRILNGLFSASSAAAGAKRSRTDGDQSGLSFTARLQTQKSLFSDKNMRSSLSNLTTSLTSLNRRQSMNPSIYGSTSALSDSRLLNTNSPFYSGRTMYGGAASASAYSSRRAASTQRTLRVPTQIRPASSLSTLSTSTNSLAATANAAAAGDASTPALSNTAKRILELMEQFKSPLEDARKMSARGGKLNESAGQVPALVDRLKRFDDFDKMKNRSGGIRLQQPRTPYSRDADNTKRLPPPLCGGAAVELQVPSMSQLLQMKKVLQSKTEKVRELAAGSQSHLNQQNADEYKLPAAEHPTGEKSSRKMRNKLNNNRTSSAAAAAAAAANERPAEPVNLPNIQLNMPKSTVPVIDIDISVPKPNKLAASTIAKTQNNIAAVSTTKTLNDQFAFSSPLQITKPAFAISAQNNFNFREPLDKFNGGNNSPQKPILVKQKEPSDASAIVQPPLKNGSVLDALKKPDAAAPLPSLSAMFKTNKTDQWECSLCMVRNDISKTKCVACESPNPTAAPAPPNPMAPLTHSFGNQFRAAASTWECDACMIRNKSDAIKCVACESPKPGAAPAPTKSTSLPAVTDAGFKSLVAKQSAKWECAACMTRNDAQRKKCECCELEKPGGGSSSSFSFGKSSSSAAAAKFSFGVPFNSTAPAVHPIVPPKTTAAAAATKTFSFGVPAVGAPTTSTTIAPTKQATGFLFGAPASAAAPAATTEASSSMKGTGLLYFKHYWCKKYKITIFSPNYSFNIFIWCSRPINCR